MVRRSPSEIPHTADRLREWERAAARRPEWTLWGKARAGEDQITIAHPLIYHMLDVALVARLLIHRYVPRAQVMRLCAAMQLPVELAAAWVAFLVALHDLGKASPGFQVKVPFMRPLLLAAGFDLEPPSPAQYHGTIGVEWISEELCSRGLPDDTSFRLARAVAAHHGAFPSDLDTDHKSRGRRELGSSPVWTTARKTIGKMLGEALHVPSERPATDFPRDHSSVVFLAGLTSVADWLGSMASVFTYEQPGHTLGAYVDTAQTRAEKALAVAALTTPFPGTSRSFVDLFSSYGFGEPWPLHQAAEKVCADLDEPSLIIVEAPMGEGKTEAALLFAEHAAARSGHAGLFVGLPTQATANQMLGRVQLFLERAHPGVVANLQLTHGGAALVERYTQLIRAIYDEDHRGAGDVRAEAWFVDKKRALLATHAVGTIDQALLGVLRIRHGFVRLFGLGGKTVILDEVHAYDTYTSTLIERLLSWLGAMGATVVLLSATLPSSRRRQLLASYGASADMSDMSCTTAYPRISVANAAGVRELGFGTLRPQRTVMLEQVGDQTNEIAATLAHAVTDGGCAVWICNTVARAQAAFLALRHLRSSGALPIDTPLVLLHSRLLHHDRQQREVEIEGLFGRCGQRPVRAVVVGTQVLEQSLDVDFDLMISDVAPIDLLLQRAGRLHRHQRQRPRHLAGPRLLLVVPEGEALVCPLQRIAGVYEELVMRRTLLALTSRSEVCLPDDIEPLIEEVYRDEVPEPHTAALAELRRRFQDQMHAENISARDRALPHPTRSDDFFGQLETRLEDDEDPTLAADLRALTRLGDPSIEVICLYEVDGHQCLDPGGHVRVDPTLPPAKDILPQLLGNGVRVSTRGLVQALQREPCPASWKKSAVLSHRRPLVFGDGSVHIAGFRLRLDRELGLIIEKEGKSE